jgi:AhpD family alkylhydroperoxidase
MPRLNLVDPATATGAAKPLLDEIKGAFGTAPNMFRAVANSPAALKSMWGAFGALGAGTIGAKLGEKIAMAVADRDPCSYCLAAHALLGKNAGASGQDVADAQAGHSDDPKTAAAPAFALKLVEQRGRRRTQISRSCARRASTTVKSSRLSPMSRSTCSPITST